MKKRSDVRIRRRKNEEKVQNKTKKDREDEKMAKKKRALES